MFDPRDLRVPIVGAPMAGGASGPALAAAVSEAGGLGYLAAGNKTAEKLESEFLDTRRATTGPVGLNLFVVEPYDPAPELLDGYRRSLEPEAARLGVALGAPAWDDDGWDAKLGVALDLRPEVVSFTFGCPPAEVFRRLAELGIHSAVTVTTVFEAREAEQRGTDSLCVQGPEAGGHRGVWAPDAVPDDTVGLADLLAAVTSEVQVPVVAAGGLTDATGVSAVMRGGAVAAQVGTALLLADEAGTHPVHRAALLDRAFTHTERTRAYTGRWARALNNRFMRQHADAPAGYPHVHHLTAPVRAAALAAGDAQTAHLWAGTGYRNIQSAPARQIIRTLTP
ncbi:MAG: nitronate monooxygenase [Ornithinibacter sp.]